MKNDREFSADTKREFMLATIRTAHARVRMLALEIEEIGVSLRCGMINAEDAVTWLDYIGAVQYVNVDPWRTKIEVAA